LTFTGRTQRILAMQYPIRWSGASTWDHGADFFGAHPAAAAVFLFVVSFALYAVTIGGGYIDFDDRAVLLAHPELYDGKSLAANLSGIFISAFPREEPLLIRDLTWAVESGLFGMVPAWPRHLGNVVLNALNVALAFVYLRRLTGRPGFAFACAAAWSVLAVHLEPVAWVMGRKDVLSAFFSLIALTLALGGIEARRPGRRFLYDAGSLVALAAAQLSKISALPLFAVLILQYALRPTLGAADAARAPLGARRFARAALRYSPHTVVSLAIFWWYSGILNQYGVTQRGPGISLGYLGILADFVPLALAEYARLLVFPFGLSILHTWPSVSIPLSSGELLAAKVVLVGVVAITAALVRYRRDLLFFWLGFWVLMVTYGNLVYIGIWVADRYLYLASLWLVALIAVPIAELVHGAPGALRAVAVGVSAAVLLLNLTVVVVHQRDWTSNEALWVYESSLPQPSLLSFHALAREYLQQAEGERDPGRRDQLVESAWQATERGLRRFAELPLSPSPYQTSERYFHSKLLFVRGRALVASGAPLQQRLAVFQEAVAADPNNPAANLAAAEILSDMAVGAPDGSEQERLARRSLEYFEGYARWAADKPAASRGAQQTLEDNWVRRFPSLQPEIAAIRARYLGGAR